MELVQRLERLKIEILGPETGEQAFETWQDIRSTLSTRQRVDILASWNLYLRTDNQAAIVNAIDDVIQAIK